MTSNVFGRFFLFLFSLLFPFLMFITLFRFYSGNPTIYGFYDIFNGLQFVSYINLEEDIKAIINALESLAKLNTLYGKDLSFDANLTNAIVNFNIPVLSTVLKAVTLSLTLLYNMANSILYLVGALEFIIKLVDTILILVLDFIPMVISVSNYLLTTFTVDTYNLLGNIQVVGNMNWLQHLNWFNNLS